MVDLNIAMPMIYVETLPPLDAKKLILRTSSGTRPTQVNVIRLIVQCWSVYANFNFITLFSAHTLGIGALMTHERNVAKHHHELA
jgi:hypothetical protein